MGMLPTNENHVRPQRVVIARRFVPVFNGNASFVRDTVSGVNSAFMPEAEADETARLMEQAYVAHRGALYAALISKEGMVCSDTHELTEGVVKFNVTRSARCNELEVAARNTDNFMTMKINDIIVSPGDVIELRINFEHLTNLREALDDIKDQT